ncbi:MAG: hypothetical protein ISS70_22590 [Phycisphaerae bacterium]|nr:hypothetical protein [Phycisphaerae bacterium]
MNRREFFEFMAGLAAVSLTPETLQSDGGSFRLRYIVASSMYGRMSLAHVLPEIGKAGAEYVDIWPERHANHREQIESMGYRKFTEMLRQHNIKLGILTRYDLGPFDIEGEMRVAKELGGSMVVCGSRGPGDLRGSALKNIDYEGWIEVFMHPVPRGIPIMPTAAQVTAQINLARAYLETCLRGPPRKT